MKKIILFFFCCSLYSAPFDLNKTYSYLEQTGNKSLNTSWTIKNDKKSLFINGKNEEFSTQLTFTPNFNLLSLKQVNAAENTDYEFVRKNNTVKIQGISKGDKISLTHKLDKEGNWVENFGYGLQPFVRSSDKSYYFNTINPNDFDLISMVAKKEDIENLTIQGRTYQAQKIRVTLQGFRSMFWHANVWFDTESYLFLKYEGDSGPDSDMTYITLESL